MAILFNNVAVAAAAVSEGITFGGGTATITVRADDYGGGTFEIQMRSNNDATADRWTTVENGLFAQDSQVLIAQLANGNQFRAQLVGGTGATNVFLEIKDH